jgi:hypothetical protein
MKKFLFLLLLSSLTSVNTDADVYICKGKSAKRYHFTKECRGLTNCKAEIKKVTIEEAKKDGRTICGYED